MISHRDVRNKFKDFWKTKKHSEVPPIPLIPKDDPTTLFTGSGMQQFVPYLLGRDHPQGARLFNVQPCLRAQDIEVVGDNNHDTFFEMMGNWSLGDYFKQEQLTWFYEFLTKELRLPKEKLYVTVFEGYKNLPKDEESYQIWLKLGQPKERIFFYGPRENWWSRGGIPDTMPSGEPGGPSSEVFFQYDVPHNKAFGEACHPNCDCGRFSEIGNNVFMQYQKQADGSFKDLPKRNVDFGGGLERLLSAANNDPDQFTTDLYSGIIAEIEEATGKFYQDEHNKPEMRVIADHIKAAVFLIVDGVVPSNKEQGYILRRLLRRAVIKMYQLGGSLLPNFDSIIDRGVLATYDRLQGIDRHTQREKIFTIVNQEIAQFSKSMDRGLKQIEKIDKIDGKIAFDFYQSYGFPLEITEELFKQKGQTVDKKEFYGEFEKHKNMSRQSAKGKFKGGLADHSEQTVKYHTATHLLHQALFDVLGEVRQDGSNITADRLRFDFTSARKPAPEEIKKVEQIMNEKIQEDLLVTHKIMDKQEAYKIGALAFFKEKYADQVQIYFIGGSTNSPQDAYSKEFCGGPHVEHTNLVGPVKIYKFEKIGANLYRVYAK